MGATVPALDDHPSSRSFARRLLEAAGSDVVLLDGMLPDTTGFELAEALSVDPAGPVVVLTSSRTAAGHAELPCA